jgi:hypothetical protein
VEEQSPFCPACGAPQIKVTAQQEDQPAPAVDGPASPTTEIPPSSSAADVAAHRINTGTQIQWKKFLRIAIPFAVANGLATTFFPPIGWFIALPGSVLWCILVYQRRCPGPLSAGRGARMGCVIGFFSFAAFAAFFVLLYCVTGQLRPFLVQAAQEAATHNYAPDLQAMIQSFSQSSAGMITFLVGLFAGSLLLFLSFGSVAGAFTAAFSGDKSKRG